MSKRMMIFIVIVLVIGAGLFSHEVLAVFRGKTPLESLQFIWQYVLHVAVITIVVFVLQSLPMVVKPWLRMMGMRLRWQWKNSRRGTVTQKAPRAPKMTTDMLLRAYIIKQMTGEKKRSESMPADETEIRF